MEMATLDPSIDCHLASIEETMKRLCGAPCDRRGHGSDGELGRIAWEHVSSGGKRLRARLALSAVQALGGRAERGIAWGAACELLHNASLIHDDVQDGDRYRRGKPALWARYGVPQAINAGDLCIALAYLAIGRVPVGDALRWRLTEVVARSSCSVVQGQAAEMGLLAPGPPCWRDYAACVEGKTAALFSLPVEGAALIAGRSCDEAVSLGQACRPVGLIFQIQDDILDLYGEGGRDMRGSDIAQPGKATALVVEHLRLHPEERGWLVGILTAPREETPRAAIEDVIERFASGGALRAVWQRIDEIRRALSRSAQLAREPALRDVLEQLVAAELLPVEHTRSERRHGASRRRGARARFAAVGLRGTPRLSGG
jgi:geranylgeranyl diphosphate synthase type I